MNELSLRNFVNECCPILPANHGFTHMARVEAFGSLLLEDVKDADGDVVHWFAYLHDIKRENDGVDPEHGNRAANYIDDIRHTYLSELNDEQIEKLKKACILHTTTHKTGDATIDVCFDADRFDLPRVGIKVDPAKMATDLGRHLAMDDYTFLCKYTNPRLMDRLVFSDKYNTDQAFIGNLAIRVGELKNGKEYSPFASQSEWDLHSKSVSIEGWYRKSGIYAVRIEDYGKGEYYSEIFFELERQLGNGIMHLLEYENDDVVSYNNTEVLASALDSLAGTNISANMVHMKEICLKRCNIIYSARIEDFWKGSAEAIRKFAEEKYFKFFMNGWIDTAFSKLP